jgi:triacylglycerol lipase
MRHAALLLVGSAIVFLTACGSPTAPVADATAFEPVFAKRAPTPTPVPPPPPVRTPIILVHGWNSRASTWSTMLSRFRADGWSDAELHAFSYDFSRSNAVTAGIIAAKVDSIRAKTGAAKVMLITHSMGSLSARYYLRNLGGDSKVAAMVSLAGVDHGTSTSYVCVQTSCMQMWPGSSFLSNLNSTDETWGTTYYATWRSPCDEVVNPRSSTILSGATNTETSCLLHSQLKEDATVYAGVRAFINAPAGPSALVVAP